VRIVPCGQYSASEHLKRFRCQIDSPMPDPLVVSDVWKSFGAVEVVKGLSLAVAAGSVYGFLGPNGVGKSTTIRMILGLQRPDKGTVSLFGQPMGRNRTDILRRIGSMVESPSLYLHLTGRENLEVHCLLLGVSTSAIDAALDSVDLRTAGNHIVRGYSSGMKQRLGLAQALLGTPDLLLLDEPTNALDPAGIQEVRHLIRDLPNRCGTTVLVSSHLLAEVEQVATHVAIIAKGEPKFEGSTGELRSRSNRHCLLKWISLSRPVWF
jgi:lantibiotic transport system ATP-binding protein